MTRQSTIALLDSYYLAFNSGNWQGMLDCLSDNVAHDVNQGGRQSGKEAFGAFLAHMERCYAEQLSDIALMANEDGSRAAAEFIVHGKYLASDEGLPEAVGQEYHLPAGAFFEVEDGLISRVRVYYNLADWIEQVS